MDANRRRALRPPFGFAAALLLVGAAGCTDSGSSVPADGDGPDEGADSPSRDAFDRPDGDALPDDVARVDDPTPGGAPPFELRPEFPVPHDLSFDPLDDPLAIGPGGAVFDADGDLDLDLFLGGYGDGTPPCLYENRSTPGELRFDAVDAICRGLWTRPIRTATALPAGNAGETLLVGGSRFLGWAPGAPGALAENLFDTLLETDDPRRRCNVDSLTPFDPDLDGDTEVYVACGHAAATAGPPVNMVLELTPVPSLWPAERAAGLADPGPTIAVAVTDLDDNGLVDLVLLNDTLSGPGRRNTSVPPGGAILAPDPLRAERDAWPAPVPVAEGVSAWGSLMGACQLVVGRQRVLYLTERGPNRILGWAGDRFDRAAETEWPDALDGYGPADVELFSWGATCWDFDADGDDDVYVTQGDVWTDRIGAALDVGHEDFWIEQRDGALLAPVRRSRLAPDDEEPRANARSSVLADLDGDGFPELLTLPLTGRPRVDRLVGATDSPGCTVFVRPAFGVRANGVTLLAPHPSFEIGGRTRIGGPSSLQAGSRSGVVQFASGWQEPFECVGAVALVSEPAWIEVDVGPGSASVRAPADAEIWLDDGVNGWRRSGPLASAARGASVMVRYRDRWVPRRWSVPPG